jgi:hypothetical protein
MEKDMLDPENNVDSDGWWTCNKETKEGDFVFLWLGNTTEANAAFDMARELGHEDQFHPYQSV